MNDERNLDLEAERFGDMLETICIFTDDEAVKHAFEKESILKAAALICKNYPAAAVDFVVAYEGTSRETTDLTRKNLLGKLLRIFKDEEIRAAFQSAE